MVAGSYHAAVFAAAQGVPTVGLVGSQYYRLKMEGLRAQFGAGVSLVRLGEPELEDALGVAIDSAWNASGDERTAMLEAAERQVNAGRGAYAALAAAHRGGGLRAA
jgi:colanic acid/amylovoran biosynthesis protein